MVDLNTFGLLAAVGKIELDNIRERVRMGMRGKVKGGTLSGVVKYGYRLEGPKGHKVAVVDEAEAEVVHRIFAEYIRGAGCHKIASLLISDGIPTRKGGMWTRQTVWAIVSSPAYIGSAEYGRVHYVKRDHGDREIKHTKRTNPAEWLTVEFPTIIDSNTWGLAQAERRNPSRQTRQYGRKHDVDHILKGLMWCGHCGSKFTTAAGFKVQYYTKIDGTQTRKQTDKMVRRYMCLNGVKPGRYCPRPRIYATTIEPAVWEAVVDFLTNPAQVRELIQDRQRDLEDGGMVAELEGARERVTEAHSERGRATYQHQKGYLTDAELDLRMKQIADVKDYHAEQLARLTSEVDGLTGAVSRLQDFVATAGQITHRLDTMTDAERTELIKLAVSRITVDETGIHVGMALDIAGGSIVSDPSSTWITS